MPRFFESGPEGPAKEITDEDELLKRQLRIKFLEQLRGERTNPKRKSPGELTKELLKLTNMSEEEWINQRVEEELKRIKIARERKG